MSSPITSPLTTPTTKSLTSSLQFTPAPDNSGLRSPISHTNLAPSKLTSGLIVNPPDNSGIKSPLSNPPESFYQS